MKLGYYPGCSLHGLAGEFDQSLQAVVGALKVDLDEVKDWNCCGATSGHATNHLLSIALSARSLALSESQGHTDLLAPCAACYSRLATADHAVKHDAALAAKVKEATGRDYHAGVKVLNLAEWLKALVPEIQPKVTRPLKDLKVACYYGCLLVRPPEVTGAMDAEQPTVMEEVVAATGATAVEWNRKLECCGGGFSIARTGSVVRLGRVILEDARKAGAQAVAVACPMCHSNLDMRQKAMARSGEAPFEMPVFYLTQLVGLALGLEPKALGVERHYVATMPLIDRVVPAQGLATTREGA